MEARDEAIIVIINLSNKKKLSSTFKKSKCYVMNWIVIWFFFIGNIVIWFACGEILINWVYNFIVFELWKFEISQKDLDF